MNRPYFRFFWSFYESAMKMSQKDRAAFLEAIIKLALTGEESKLTRTADIVFTAIKPVIEQSTLDFANGKNGGRPKKEKGVFENKKGGLFENEKGVEKNSETYKDKDKDKDIYKDKEKESIEKKVAVAPALPRFVKPTIQEVAAYAASLQYRNFNAERFYAYYESNGWRVGKNPMKSWKGAVVNWHQREQEQPSVRKPVDNIHSIGDFTYERTTI